ncbi:MAG: pentapeptide repeat-containing protein [Neisseriaceae bacterium]
MNFITTNNNNLERGSNETDSINTRLQAAKSNPNSLFSQHRKAIASICHLVKNLAPTDPIDLVKFIEGCSLEDIFNNSDEILMKPTKTIASLKVKFSSTLEERVGLFGSITTCLNEGLAKELSDIFKHVTSENQAKTEAKVNALLSSFSDVCIDLTDLYLRAANFEGAELREADFQEANLYSAVFYGADLQRANLRRTNLRWGNFAGGANLRWANLQEANMQEADFWEADLQWADLRGADLREAILQEANLQGANLLGAISNDPEIQKLISLQNTTKKAIELSAGQLEESSTLSVFPTDIINLFAQELYKVESEQG